MDIGKSNVESRDREKKREGERKREGEIVHGREREREIASE